MLGERSSCGVFERPAAAASSCYRLSCHSCTMILASGEQGRCAGFWVSLQAEHGRPRPAPNVTTFDLPPSASPRHPNRLARREHQVAPQRHAHNLRAWLDTMGRLELPLAHWR